MALELLRTRSRITLSLAGVVGPAHRHSSSMLDPDRNRHAEKPSFQFQSDPSGGMPWVVVSGSNLGFDRATRPRAQRTSNQRFDPRNSTLWGENEKVPCHVLNVKDPAKAADIFSKINMGRSKPQPVERFLVAVTAGYAAEVKVNEIVTGLGHYISNSKEEGAIRAAEACLNIYRRRGAEVLRSVLLVLQGTWGKDHAAVFSTSEDIGFPGGTRLTITLEFNVNNKHNIGRPRLAISTSSEPARLDGETVLQQ